MRSFDVVRLLVVVLLLVASPALARRDEEKSGITGTAHNLSPGGPGRERARARAAAADPDSAPKVVDEKEAPREICIYCHTPHGSTAKRGLWNRSLSPVTYELYSSPSLNAAVKQPTGASRLCLSCHDGVMALGHLKYRPDPSLGKLTGPAVLGSDLSDDHPVSFVYDQDLAAKNGELVDPKAVSESVRLDKEGEVQCTSCHNAHSDRYRSFLWLDVANSELCLSCHSLKSWRESSHAASPATAKSGAELPGWGFATVGENGCSVCHDTHGAAHPVYLLREPREEETCFACHGGGAAQKGGTVATKDLGPELAKPSTHDVAVYEDVHNSAEEPARMPRHVECTDCHQPHRAREATSGGGIAGPLVGASGIDLSGGFVEEARAEYEVCLKCHGMEEAPSPTVVRADNVTNVRLEIQPGNPSFHPIAATGRSTAPADLLPPLTPNSQIACTSCHNNDAWTGAEDSVPRGPHGSIYAPILAREYRLEGFPGDTPQFYSLCYGCHSQQVLLGAKDGGFPHRLHVEDVGASCAVCHDAHGSRQNPHLINFMTVDVNRDPVVKASSSGELRYESLGPGAGRCSLTCHGTDHDPEEYSSVGAGAQSFGAGGRAPRRSRAPRGRW